MGELARRAGLIRKAIRFDGGKRVLPLARRGDGRLPTVSGRNGRDGPFREASGGLGLTPAEIREVIAIREGGRPPCAHVHRLLREKAAELDGKLRDLLQVRQRIRLSLAAWRRRPVKARTVCPHIEAVQGRARPTPACEG